jgi:glycine/D-amino acid oxidase-like deaminating enzyme/nitrite reductase/ring-hydroxylating ferredoxin subunit
MVPTTTATRSLWLAGTPAAAYPPPSVRREFDVLVLGGGITGLTTALLLTRAGARVAVVEADVVGSGATGNSTGKVSALQAVRLGEIADVRGEAVAVEYARASAAAVERVAALAEGIDCDLVRRPAYTVAPEDAALPAVHREADLAGAAGLPVTTTTDVGLPYPVAGAVRLEEQIELQPVRYARGLAAAIHREGGTVFEHTRALGVREERPIRIETEHGPLTGDHVVVATHYPLFDRGLFFARMSAYRSYCVAARVRDEPHRGLTITTGSATWSYRSAGELLVACGAGHATGGRRVDAGAFRLLEEHVRTHWDVEEFTHHWSAQDATCYDSTPMIGTYTPLSARLHLATGFAKWGLTGGTVAATLLTEQIAGRRSSDTFSPHRLSPRGLPTLARENVKVAVALVGDRFLPGQVSSPTEIPRGQARVIRSGTDRTGVFRDDEDGLHAVSLRCTHLGCLVRFNAAERSWDCPCHGSRFDVDGAVLEGPAVEPLARRTPGPDLDGWDRATAM